MISMARTLGAPDTVPAGSVARSTSIGPLPSAQLARHLRGEVHHVAVALERHQLVDLLGAELHHPADVVAGQVDEHDVLGDLLRVLAQLGGQAAVLLVGAAPAAGAGDRAGRSPCRRAAAPSARATSPTRVTLGVAHEVHVRARVHLAQHPVDVERVGVEVEVEALRQHDLEDVAGEDVLLGHLDRLGSRRSVPIVERTSGSGSSGSGGSTSGSSSGRAPSAASCVEPARRPRRRPASSSASVAPSARPARCR